MLSRLRVRAVAGPARIDAYYAKYETCCGRCWASAAEMAGAFTTALRITPTRWRVIP